MCCVCCVYYICPVGKVCVAFVLPVLCVLFFFMCGDLSVCCVREMCCVHVVYFCYVCCLGSLNCVCFVCCVLCFLCVVCVASFVCFDCCLLCD